MKTYVQTNSARLYEQKRDQRYQKKFGITLVQYNQMLADQGGVCAICGKAPKQYHLAVDHSHITGKVRMLLCLPCNKVLGYLENATWLAKAWAYLARFV
jgi:hypothetical protein